MVRTSGHGQFAGTRIRCNHSLKRVYNEEIEIDCAEARNPSSRGGLGEETRKKRRRGEGGDPG